MSDPTAKPRIVVPTPYFDPAYKAGGAAKSVLNLVEALSDEFTFHVHCLDSDIDGSLLDLPSRHRPLSAGTVDYHGKGELDWARMRGWFASCDLIYLNGFFGPVFSLKIAALRRVTPSLRNLPLLVAPRGELFAETLRLKATKKRLGVAAINAAGLYRDAHWHASTEQECAVIASMAARLGQRAPDIHVACDIATKVHGSRELSTHSGRTRLVFFSRISPKKNLAFALRVLAQIKTPLALDIIGPIEDQTYWASCQELIAAAPQHEIAYKGTISPSEVDDTLAGYDLLLFPTKSENFGHVIHEALAASVPVLISDQTPWRGLASAGAGWDLPLDEQCFADALRTFQASVPADRTAMRVAARRFSERFDSAEAIDDHRRMLRAVLAAQRNR
jgi:glycosyltransferase involved in cell wall biosynthesis